MKYNDFLEHFDAKTFEKIAKEYEIEKKANVKILSENDKNFDKFIKKYEDFLTILMTNNKENLQQKRGFLKGKKEGFFTNFSEAISRFCTLYFEIKGDYFLPPYQCNFYKEKGVKEDMILTLKELIFLSAKCPNFCFQNSLIDNAFFLAKLL